MQTLNRNSTAVAIQHTPQNKSTRMIFLEEESISRAPHTLRWRNLPHAWSGALPPQCQGLQPRHRRARPTPMLRHHDAAAALPCERLPTATARWPPPWPPGELSPCPRAERWQLRPLGSAPQRARRKCPCAGVAALPCGTRRPGSCHFRHRRRLRIDQRCWPSHVRCLARVPWQRRRWVHSQLAAVGAAQMLLFAQTRVPCGARPHSRIMMTLVHTVRSEIGNAHENATRWMTR